MWCHSRMCFSPVRSKLPPQTCQITRHLRTQCTNFHPRGFTRHDVAETGSRGRIPVEQESETPQVRIRHKDHRPIDSMDPVVLKYTNIVNEMRSKSSGVERVNLTNFGSIRFDNENVPHLHGQYDEYGPATTRDRKTAADFHFKLDPTAGRTGVVKIIEPRQVESEDRDGYREQQVRADPHTGELIDSREMRNYLVHSASSESEGVPVRESVSSASNFIDAQVFGDTLSSSTANSVTPAAAAADPLHSSSNPLHGSSKSEQSHETGDTDVKDLNYVDEFFFKNSLENLEINRQPAIDYSEIKKDLESTLLYRETQHGEGSKVWDGEVVDESERVQPESVKSKDNLSSKNKVKEHLSAENDNETPKSAFDYIVKKRQEEHKREHGLGLTPGDGSKKSYKKILSLVSEKTKDKFTRHEVLKTLKSSILYNDHDIVGLYKSYGIAMHGGGDSQYHILTDYLPDLATFLKAEALYPVHRLDATTTGVVLLARTQAMADILKGMFKEHHLKKTYWTITKAIPKHMQGIIDIPIAEGLVDGRRRMVLKPDVKDLKSTSTDGQMAVTRFKVISKRNSAALVELLPMTGVKHQLRVHMGFGLSCPILGDHKYSHLKKMAPQALPGDMLHSLRVKQSRVRDLPLYLHCKSILVPEILDGKNIFIQAKIPAFFNKTLSLLKLNRHESRVKLKEPLAPPP